MTTRDLSRRSLMATLLCAAALPALGQTDDTSNIEWVVGFPPGGGADTSSRFLAELVSKNLGRPIIVTNKPGASTQIAADYVAAARGGNMFFTADFSTLATNASLYPRLRYSPERDFIVLGMQARTPMVLVGAPNIPANNFRELLAWANKNGQDVAYGSAGLATPHHLAAELLKAQSGLKLAHVPYKGAAPAISDVMAGQIPLCMADLATARQYILAGKVKAFGISSAKRSPNVPDVPTFIEQGLPDYETYAWQAIVVPSKTPPTQVARFRESVVAVLDSQAVKERYDTLGFERMQGTPEEVATFIAREQQRWAQVIRTNNIKLD